MARRIGLARRLGFDFMRRAAPGRTPCTTWTIAGDALSGIGPGGPHPAGRSRKTAAGPSGRPCAFVFRYLIGPCRQEAAYRLEAAADTLPAAADHQAAVAGIRLQGAEVPAG